MSAVFADLQPYGEETLLHLAANLGFEDPVVILKDDADPKYGVASSGNNGIIRGKRNDRDETLKVFTKKAPTDDNVRRYTFVTEMFDRESYLYDVVLPKFEEVIEDYVDGDNSPMAFVKYFGSCKVEGQEYLVLEDIDAQGYKVVGLIGPLIDASLRSSLKWLAHFHGLSFVMKKRDPNLFDEWILKLEDYAMRDTEGLKWQSFENYVTYFGFRFEDLLRHEGYSSECIEKSYSRYFREMRKNFTFYYSPKQYGVICHGDFHTYNVLCNKDGNAGAIRVVDYQWARYTSPCLDLILFLSCILDKNFKDTAKPLINLYRQYLAGFVASYGYDIEELYPSRVFEEEWRAYVPYAMMYGVCGVVQMFCKLQLEEPPSLVDIMLANVPPHVWDMRTVTGELWTYYLKLFEMTRWSEVDKN